MQEVSRERIVCPKCHGRGYITVSCFGHTYEDQECPTCKGLRVVDKVIYFEYVPVE